MIVSILRGDLPKWPSSTSTRDSARRWPLGSSVLTADSCSWPTASLLSARLSCRNSFPRPSSSGLNSFSKGVRSIPTSIGVSSPGRTRGTWPACPRPSHGQPLNASGANSCRGAAASLSLAIPMVIRRSVRSSPVSATPSHPKQRCVPRSRLGPFEAGSAWSILVRSQGHPPAQLLANFGEVSS